MKVEFLKEFIVLAQYMNYRVAAEKLFISQPRLSEHIQSLEKEVGFKLLDREGALSLTYEGRRFLEAASEAVEALDACVAQCRRSWAQENSTITVMKPALIEQLDPVVSLGLHAAIDGMSGVNSGVRFMMPHTVAGHSEFEALRGGKTDVAYVYLGCPAGENVADVLHPAADISVRVLARTGFCAWMPREGVAAETEAVGLEDLCRRTVLVPACLELASLKETVEGLFAGMDRPPAFHRQFSDTASAFLVSPIKGDEVRILPSCVGSQFLFGTRVLPITDAAGRGVLGVAYLSDASPALLELVERLAAFDYGAF